MSKIITSSVWNASNIPNGISFDSANGIFSGTPIANAGEYIVPVSVTTNYGSDSKNVKIVVLQKTYDVYAIGYKAADWSKNAEPDEFGFRPLNIPKATHLEYNHSGFVAYLPSSHYYYCGACGFETGVTNPISNMLLTKDEPYYNGNTGRFAFLFHLVYSHDGNVSAPSSSNIQQQFYVALSRVSGTTSFTISTSGRAGYKGSSSNSYANSSAFNLSSGVTLPEYFYPTLVYFSTRPGIRWLSSSGEQVHSLRLSQPSKSSMNVNASIVSSDLGYRAVKIFQSSLFDCLSENMTLDDTSANFTFGKIKNAWFLRDIGYVLTESHDLYMYDPEAWWSYLGNWNIKKLQPSGFDNTALFLTEDGQLFHKGSALDGICEAHDTFSPIFNEISIQDFSLSHYRFLTPTTHCSLTILK